MTVIAMGADFVVMNVLIGLVVAMMIGGGFVIGVAEDPDGCLVGFLGLAVATLLILVDTGAIRTDVCCKYAAATVERAQRACIPHGGVQSFPDPTVICKDGRIVALETGYYKPGHRPVP